MHNFDLHIECHFPMDEATTVPSQKPRNRRSRRVKAEGIRADGRESRRNVKETGVNPGNGVSDGLKEYFSSLVAVNSLFYCF